MKSLGLLKIFFFQSLLMMILTACNPEKLEIKKLDSNETPIVVSATLSLDSITTATADGAYNIGTNIGIVATFTEPITINGTPSIVLNTGDVVSMSSSTATTITFSYTVGAGDLSTDLSVTNFDPGISIQNALLENADLTLPIPGGGNDLDEIKDIAIDTTPPILIASQMSLNSGAATTQNSNLSVAFQATDVASNITEFCLKYDNNIQPILTDPCWQAIDGPDPGITPSLNVTVPATFKRVGFTPSSYTVYVFVKDAADNISVHTSTAGLDQDDITVFFNNAPEITDILATATSTPSDPVISADISISVGNDVHIKWNASDVEGLSASPINLYYTTDNITYTSIPGASNLNNGANGCTVNEGGTTADDNATGCFVWTGGAPTSSFFRIRVEAVDNGSSNASATSVPINGGSFRVLAGNTDRGIGNAANSIILSDGVRSSSDNDESTMVILPNGEVYIADTTDGIIKIDPNTGVSSIYIPFGSDQSDGVVSTAEVVNVAKMFLDYENRIIIYDFDRMRRIDTIAGTITTIIGGGGNADPNGVAPLMVQLPDVPRDDIYIHRFMFAMPDGRIFFETDQGYGDDTETFYYYDPTFDQVFRVSPTGVGSSGDAAFDLASNNCNFGGFYLSHDLNTTSTTVTEAFFRFSANPIAGCANGNNPIFVNLNTSTFNSQAPHSSTVTSSIYARSFIHGMDGKIYGLDRDALYEWNTSTKDWDRILGTTTLGSCGEGVAATTCNVNLYDAFVSMNGDIYVNDAGAIRTIDENGDIRTLYGQKKNFGDGEIATSARFNNIKTFQVWDDGGTEKVVVLDKNEFRFREFSLGGNIGTLLGNGTTTAFSYGGNGSQGLRSTDQGITFQMHPTNGDIFYHNYSDAAIWYRTDVWRKLYGGSAETGPSQTDGTLASLIQWGNYQPPVILGMDLVNNKVLYGDHDYNSGTQKFENSFIFTIDFTDTTYDYTTATYSYILGIEQDDPGGNVFCADGNFAATCSLNKSSDPDWSDTDGKKTTAYYYGSDQWLLHTQENSTDSTRIVMIQKGAAISTFTTLDNNGTAFTYRNDAGTEYIYYCGTDGNIYSRNVTAGTETTLTISTPGVSCYGWDLHYNTTRDTLMFIFKENGMLGVGEYINP